MTGVGREGSSRLRIGYLSEELREDGIASFVQPFFQDYERRWFEVYAYSLCDEDPGSWRLAVGIQQWRNIAGDTLEQAVQEIRADHIDILVLLARDKRARSLEIFAEQPSIIQITELGTLERAVDVSYYIVEVETEYIRRYCVWAYGRDRKLWEQRAEQEFQHMVRAADAEEWAEVLYYARDLLGYPFCPLRVKLSLGYAYAFQQDDSLGRERAAAWMQIAAEQGREPDAFLYMILAEKQEFTLDTFSAHHWLQRAVDCLPQDVHRKDRSFKYNLYHRLGYLSYMLGYAAEAVAAYCKASEYGRTLRERTGMFSSMVFAAHCLELSSAELFALHRSYAALFEGIRPYRHGKRSDRRQTKLHVAYLSPDFRKHVMMPIYYGLLAFYDRSQFFVTCYSVSTAEDAVTTELAQLVDDFVPLGKMSYEEMAKRIYADGVDILVDLAGHSSGSGLPVLAWKPAPVQVSGLGYMATTALPTVDYFITDCWVDPPGWHEACFTEQLLYLPSQFSYQGRPELPAAQGTPCRKRGYVLFASFNHYRKITDEMLRAWQEILARVPDSKLLIKTQMLERKRIPEILLERMDRLGFDRNRIVLEPATRDYMNRCLDVDLMLDTYPYPGGGTTLDALYMGVPVVTRYGERRGTRFGLSILQNIGLGELAADSIQGYVECAVQLAGDWGLLDLLHRQLRSLMKNAQGLDPESYVRHLEQQYKKIWKTYQEQKNDET